MNKLRTWTVKITRWDIYEVRGVRATSSDHAVTFGLEAYELTDDYHHVDGGVTSVNVEEEE